MLIQLVKKINKYHNPTVDTQHLKLGPTGEYLINYNLRFPFHLFIFLMGIIIIQDTVLQH